VPLDFKILDADGFKFDQSKFSLNFKIFEKSSDSLSAQNSMKDVQFEIFGAIKFARTPTT
jgi:hypothetical protein